MLTSSGRHLGIEFTTFHLAPAPGEQPHQERQSLKERVVALAEQLHHDAGGPALYVTVIFNLQQSLRKKDTQSLARALANAILENPMPRTVREPSVDLSWEHLPKGISHIRIHGSVDGEDRLWQSDAGGWVAEVGPEDVARVVNAKADRGALARKQCDDLWLVIVNDDFSGAAPAQISQAALDAVYAAPFERLLWLVPTTPRAIDLEIRSQRWSRT